MACPWQSNFVANKVNSIMDSHCLLKYLDHRSFFLLALFSSLQKTKTHSSNLLSYRGKQQKDVLLHIFNSCQNLPKSKTTDPLQPSYNTDNSEFHWYQALNKLHVVTHLLTDSRINRNWCQQWRSVSQHMQMLHWEEHHWKCPMVGWLGTEETNTVKGQHSLRQKNVREM